MQAARKNQGEGSEILEKSPTGIQGFDEITFGGLPKGRPTIIIGGPGSGKTLFAMEFLVNGAVKYGETGVFIAFEETEKELEKKYFFFRFRCQKPSPTKQIVY